MKIKHKKILVCGLSLAVLVSMICGCTEVLLKNIQAFLKLWNCHSKDRE
ncbi:MAG TPA: hypothetical protein OIL92_00890 [Oscillospiraceae bacterium]|nr:hypothetical protein [Oscillospiraceae bacterium]